MKKPLLLLLCLFTVIGYAKDPHIKAVYALSESHPDMGNRSNCN